MYRKTFVYKHIFVYKQSGLDSKKHIECQSKQTNQQKKQKHKKNKDLQTSFGKIVFFLCFFFVFFGFVIPSILFW